MLSNGTEASKGTELTRAADEILAAAAAHKEAEFDYVGYVEGSEIFHGNVDVVATDGFTGNVVLKTAEGVAEAPKRLGNNRSGSQLSVNNAGNQCAGVPTALLS